MRLATVALLLTGCATPATPVVSKIANTPVVTASPVPTPEPRPIVVRPTAPPTPAGVQAPKAAPKVAPKPVGSVEAYIRSAYPWPSPDKAVAVARCESSGFQHRFVYGPETGAAGERGVFQIHPGHYDGRWGGRPIVKALGYSFDDMWNVAKNTHVAWELSNHGRNWGPWTCAR